MSHRTDIKRIYNKIDTIVRSSGKSAIYQYLTYVNECISNGEYYKLEDVLVSYYGIDARKYKSTDEMAKKSFPLIRELTISSEQKKFKTLFTKNSIYSIGNHFFDEKTSQYLGDIVEVEEDGNRIWYKSKDLTVAQSANGTNIDELNYTGGSEIKIFNLEVIRGLTPSILEAIPSFNLDVKQTVQFGTNSLTIWDNKIYRCINPYTWSSNNMISPTYSDYWVIPNCPTYSYTLINSDTVPLIQKYQLGINILKQTTYTV